MTPQPCCKEVLPSFHPVNTLPSRGYSGFLFIGQQGAIGPCTQRFLPSWMPSFFRLPGVYLLLHSGLGLSRRSVPFRVRWSRGRPEGRCGSRFPLFPLAMVTSLLPAMAAAQHPNDTGESASVGVFLGHALEPRFVAPPPEPGQDARGEATHVFYLRTVEGEAVLIASTSAPPEPGQPLEVTGTMHEDPLGGWFVSELSRRTPDGDIEARIALEVGDEDTSNPGEVVRLPWRWVVGGLALGAFPFLGLAVAHRIRDGPSHGRGPLQDVPPPAGDSPPRSAPPLKRVAGDGTKRVGSKGAV